MLLFKGRLVKGVSFKNHLDVGNPATTCKALESQKADEIIIIDLESYREPKKEIDYKSLSEISKSFDINYVWRRHYLFRRSEKMF